MKTLQKPQKTQKIQTLLKTLDVEFKNLDWLSLALTHRSADAQNNERLEFLGDAVLNCVIAAVLFEKYPNATEGQLSRLRSKLVNQEFLAQIATEFNLSNYLKMGQGEHKTGGTRRKSTLSDTLEAIIGAVYLDSGFEASHHMLLKWFEPRLETIKSHKSEALKDPKSLLQEYCQAKKMALPVYTVTAITGQSHRQHFQVLCELSVLEKKAEGAGSSRREAEQKAAEKILGSLS